MNCFKVFSRYLKAILILGLSGGSVCYADTAEVTVVLSDNGQLYQQVYEGIRSRLHPGVLVNLENAKTWLPGTTGGMHVSVGAAATSRLLEVPELPLRLSVLIPSQALHALLAGNPEARQALAEGKLSAIYLDQPASRQINLAKLIRPGVKSIGTIYDQPSKEIALQLQRAATDHGLSFSMLPLAEDDNPVSVLRKMYADIDVFIAIPATYIFDGTIAKWMLYLSFQNGKPLLGFSAAYTRSGALASVYSDPEDIARQAARWINDLILSQGKLPPPAYPDHFQVTLNKQVAARLNLGYLDAEQIEEELKSMERTK